MVYKKFYICIHIIVCVYIYILHYKAGFGGKYGFGALWPGEAAKARAELETAKSQARAPQLQRDPHRDLKEPAERWFGELNHGVYENPL